VSDFQRAWLTERFPWRRPHHRNLLTGSSWTSPFLAAGAEASEPDDRLVAAWSRRKVSTGSSMPAPSWQSSGVEFDCKIVGTGELEGALTAQIERLGLQGACACLGPRPRREVIEILRDAAVFAGSYAVGDDGNRDGLPTVLVEAMGVGTPCVATAVTGVPEAVTTRRPGC